MLQHTFEVGAIEKTLKEVEEFKPVGADQKNFRSTTLLLLRIALDIVGIDKRLERIEKLMLLDTTLNKEKGDG